MTDAVFDLISPISELSSLYSLSHTLNDRDLLVSEHVLLVDDPIDQVVGHVVDAQVRSTLAGQPASSFSSLFRTVQKRINDVWLQSGSSVFVSIIVITLAAFRDPFTAAKQALTRLVLVGLFFILCAHTR